MYKINAYLNISRLLSNYNCYIFEKHNMSFYQIGIKFKDDLEKEDFNKSYNEIFKKEHEFFGVGDYKDNFVIVFSLKEYNKYKKILNIKNIKKGWRNV